MVSNKRAIDDVESRLTADETTITSEDLQRVLDVVDGEPSVQRKKAAKLLADIAAAFPDEVYERSQKIDHILGGRMSNTTKYWVYGMLYELISFNPPYLNEVAGMIIEDIRDTDDSSISLRALKCVNAAVDAEVSPSVDLTNAIALRVNETDDSPVVRLAIDLLFQMVKLDLENADISLDCLLAILECDQPDKCNQAGRRLIELILDENWKIRAEQTKIRSKITGHRERILVDDQTVEAALEVLE